MRGSSRLGCREVNGQGGPSWHPVTRFLRILGRNSPVYLCETRSACNGCQGPPWCSLRPFFECAPYWSFPRSLHSSPLMSVLFPQQARHTPAVGPCTVCSLFLEVHSPDGCMANSSISFMFLLKLFPQEGNNYPFYSNWTCPLNHPNSLCLTLIFFFSITFIIF